MKTISFLLFANYVFLSTCSFGQLLPTDTWSQDCVELAPYQGTYKLSGLCCTSITLPQIDLDKTRFFLIIAMYYTFNGAGIINFPIAVNGELSLDRKTLILNYSINSILYTHILKPGKATTSCDCVCD